MTTLQQQIEFFFASPLPMQTGERVSTLHLNRREAQECIIGDVIDENRVLADHADLHKRSADRDREILKTLNRAFGSLILHEITAHRIEQFKRERLAGRWRAHGQKGASKPLKPATVNRELDTLKSILAKAVEWKKLLD